MSLGRQHLGCTHSRGPVEAHIGNPDHDPHDDGGVDGNDADDDGEWFKRGNILDETGWYMLWGIPKKNITNITSRV